MNIQFATADVDKCPKTSQTMEIRTVPTVIIIKEGKEVNRFSGLRSKEEFIKIIQEQL